MPTTTTKRRRAPRRPDAPPPRILIGLEAAAERLDISSRTLRRMIRAEQLPAFRVGHQIKLDVVDVDALARPIDPESVCA